MKKRHGIVLTLTLLFSTLGVLSLSESYESKKDCDTVAIVTLKDNSELKSTSKKTIFNDFKDELIDTVGFNYKIIDNLTNIGNYVILKVNQNDVTKLKALNSVSNVELNHQYETTNVKNYSSSEENSKTSATSSEKPVNYSIKQMKAEASTTRGKNTLIAVLDNFFQLNHEAFKDLDSNVVKYTKDEMSSVVGGKALTARGNTYYNNKIPFYYDYADSDNDVLARGATVDNTHGIHVASMAAANGDKFEGISPNAQLALMKISSDANIGSSSDATILRALNDAVAIGADVINLSFGSPIDTQDGIRDEELKADNSTLFGAIKNLSDKGIVMSISAGNEGRGSYIKDNVQTNDYGDYCNFSLDNVEPGIIGGFAESNYGTIVASGRLNAEYDSTVGQSSEYTKKVSGFSSEGATFDMHIGVDVITPGQNTWGAVYYANNPDEGYKQMDGTSMAAPNYSGVVASVLSELIKDNPENREEIAKTLTERIQSTAEPFVQYNDTYYSPRKQGAGQPNIEKAVNSDVYLSSNYHKAKIELFNSEDIKNGHIKFSVNTHNETSTDKKYKLNLSVECPGFAKDGTEASLMNQLIDEFNSEVTIKSGESQISVDYQIKDEAKKILEKFPNGTYIEGYLTLTPIDGEGNVLSAPYMGFYGDFDKADCVEDFDFEKEDKNAITGSEILSSLYRAKGRANADFTSSIYMNDESLSGYFSKVVAGNDSLKNLANAPQFEDGKLVAGVNNLSNYLIISEIVYRNIKNNSIKLIDKSGAVVKETKFTNYNENDQYKNDTGYLQKSLALNESSGITSSKAIAQIQLRDSTGKLLYPAGEYTLQFDFDLMYGSHQTKQYKLVIKDESAFSPVIGKKEVKDDKIRVNLESNTKSVAVNGDSYNVLIDGDQKYIEIETKKYEGRGKILLEVVNEFNLKTLQLFTLKDLENGFSVESSLLKATYTPSLEMTVGEVGTDGKFDVNYVTGIKNARGNNVNDIQSYVVNIKLPSNARVTPKDDETLDDLIVVKEIVGKNQNTIKYTVHDGYLSYETRTGKVVATYVKGKEPVVNPPSNDDGNKNNSLLIAGCVGAGVVVVGAAVGVTVYAINKKKKKNGNKD